MYIHSGRGRRHSFLKGKTRELMNMASNRLGNAKGPESFGLWDTPPPHRTQPRGGEDSALLEPLCRRERVIALRWSWTRGSRCAEGCLLVFQPH